MASPRSGHAVRDADDSRKRPTVIVRGLDLLADRRVDAVLLELRSISASVMAGRKRAVEPVETAARDDVTS